ncbi:hypothetical protein B0T26DRAFT_740547 [Lasiosphaeria miniovina]|uniref:Co-chaperone HscB C-terminal oligomerisation domain-containing protein n=1 Tax=Lasiosphaeria miniovina TaxID=1954250 RepID=A0AA40AJH0_9PEZI|nr:uncharacterized protein B0T26DRAFT_740547 [Lasiosphaeria miniovina]KAK0716937.1 hypothetical protein B0T26DRAFT_740547 [Lasiosphaeria miniovina]
MRASMVLNSVAVTRVCAACRGAATPPAPLSSSLSSPAFPTAAARIPRAPARCWLSQSRSTLASQPTIATAADPRPDSESHQQRHGKVPTYYALFPETLPAGPPPSGLFHINVRALRREFLRLQAAAHPDFHHHAAKASSSSPSNTTTAPDEQQCQREGNSAAQQTVRAAGATSALINQAYKTLSSPLARAQYLLREQHGADLEGDEHGAETDPLDAELLTTVLEAREAIEDAAREADLAPVRAANDARIAACEDALARAFEGGDLEAAKAETVRLRYWINIRESVDNWERGKPVVLHH